jgi:hypothetical protein
VQKIDKVVALVAEFFVDEEFSREEIAGVVREAYEVADVDFGAEEAARAAEDFEWPEEVLTRDSHKAAQAGFSLERMVQDDHDSKAHDRLSPARINSLLGSEGQEKGREKSERRLHPTGDLVCIYHTGSSGGQACRSPSTSSRGRCASWCDR